MFIDRWGGSRTQGVDPRGFFDSQGKKKWHTKTNSDNKRQKMTNKDNNKHIRRDKSRQIHASKVFDVFLSKKVLVNRFFQSMF